MAFIMNSAKRSRAAHMCVKDNEGANAINLSFDSTWTLMKDGSDISYLVEHFSMMNEDLKCVDDF